MPSSIESANSTEKEVTIADFPTPPPDAVFELQKVETVSLPHPYCITPKHVGVAADQFAGILGEAALEAAEKQGARCGMRDCHLPYSKHESVKTLFIKVPNRPKDLNDVPGLHAYLLSIKEQAEGLGITGFAFPDR